MIRFSIASFVKKYRKLIVKKMITYSWRARKYSITKYWKTHTWKGKSIRCNIKRKTTDFKG